MITQSLANGLHEALNRTCLRPPRVETHTIVLPHALVYNASAVAEAAMRIERAIGAADAARGLFDLAKRLGAKMTLRDIGMPESGIDKAADLAVTNAYWNPRPMDRNAVRELIARAWAGEPPSRRPDRTRPR